MPPPPPPRNVDAEVAGAGGAGGKDADGAPGIEGKNCCRVGGHTGEEGSTSYADGSKAQRMRTAPGIKQAMRSGNLSRASTHSLFVAMPPSTFPVRCKCHKASSYARRPSCSDNDSWNSKPCMCRMFSSTSGLWAHMHKHNSRISSYKRQPSPSESKNSKAVAAFAWRSNVVPKSNKVVANSLAPTLCRPTRSTLSKMRCINVTS
mmetsp:Transcript_52480/g.147323  ORF Transcript_52480/g.147323 Transcript_52480/m.147323 type:complete len:205 (+) Transcript_52480:513-1127(+)